MTAISVSDSIRYWIRLFSYFLGLAVVGGGLTGGGIYLLREANAMPGGAGVDVGRELAGGVAATTVGVVFLVAGFLVVVLNVVADGVRVGIDEAIAGREHETPEPEATDAETDEGEESDAAAFSAGVTSSAQQERQQGNLQDRKRPSPRDDEQWKREVEQKLATEDREEQPPATAPGSGESDEAAEADASIDDQKDQGTVDRLDEGSEPGEPAETVSPGVAPSEGDADGQPETAEQVPADEGDGEWMSGEEVREGDVPSRAPTGEQQLEGADDERPDLADRDTAEDRTDPFVAGSESEADTATDDPFPGEDQRPDDTSPADPLTGNGRSDDETGTADIFAREDSSEDEGATDDVPATEGQSEAGDRTADLFAQEDDAGETGEEAAVAEDRPETDDASGDPLDPDDIEPAADTAEESAEAPFEPSDDSEPADVDEEDDANHD